MNFHPRRNGKLAALSLSELDGIPVTWLGGLPIAAIDRARSADLMINLAISRRGSGGPAPYITSANGQVLSLCASDSEIRALFLLRISFMPTARRWYSLLGWVQPFRCRSRRHDRPVS